MATDQQQSRAGAAVERAQQQGREVASQAQEKVQGKAEEVKSQAGGRLRQEVDRRSTQAGEQAQTLAGALRRTAEHLRTDGSDRHATVTERAADRIESVGGYLHDSDADRILGDVEDIARRRPWLIGAAAAVVGFAASRFLKASSARRYNDRQAANGNRARFDTGYAGAAPQADVYDAESVGASDRGATDRGGW